MDVDSSSQFAVEVLQAFVEYSGCGVNLFSDQLGHVFQRLFSFALHDDLAGDVFFPAEYQAVFQWIGDGQVIGNQVAFSPEQAVYQFRFVFYHLYAQLQSQRTGELLGQFILKAHRLSPIVEVGCRTVDGESHKLSPFLDLRQVDGRNFVLLRLAGEQAEADEQAELLDGITFHRPTIFSIYSFSISMAFSLCPPCGTMRSAIRLAGSMNSRCMGLSTRM